MFQPKINENSRKLALYSDRGKFNTAKPPPRKAEMYQTTTRRSNQAKIVTDYATSKKLPPKPTFTPKINAKISDDLDNRMRVLAAFERKDRTGDRRCDTLYELALHNKDKLDLKRAFKEEEHVEELTFRPKTNKTKHEDLSHRDVAERNRAWAENKLKKIE
jgi:hypothetical protein